MFVPPTATTAGSNPVTFHRSREAGVSRPPPADEKLYETVRIGRCAASGESELRNPWSTPVISLVSRRNTPSFGARPATQSWTRFVTFHDIQPGLATELVDASPKSPPDVAHGVVPSR